MSLTDASLWLRRKLTEEGPSELFAIMRCVAVLVTWSRLGPALVPHVGLGSWGQGVAMVFWCASLAMLVGWKARWASFVTALCVYAVFADHLRYGDGNLNNHHVMAQGLLCFHLALLPCDRALVLGRPLSWSRPGPLWGMHLLRLHLSILYCGATWEKLYPGWVSGERMEQVLMRIYTTSDPLGAAGRATAFAIANGTVLVEAALCVAALFARSRRARWGSYAVAVFFHAGVYVLTPVSTFSVTMAVWWMVVLPADEVRRWMQRWMPAAGPFGAAPDGAALPFGLGTAVLVALAVAGPFTPWLPDRSGFETYGEDICAVELKDGAVIAGVRARVKGEACKAGPMRSAHCVVDGRWGPVTREVVCAPAKKGPKRRVQAR